MKKEVFILLVLLVVLMASCKKYVPAPEAFFLQPQYTNLSVTSTSLQGSSVSKITDLFLYVDGKFQGIYQSTAKMPVVSRGQRVTIDVFAGIKNNGINETVIVCPFYTRVEMDTAAPGGSTVNRGFTFAYNPSTSFMWLEDFDGLGVSLVRSMITSTSTGLNLVSGPDACENKSAFFQLNGEILGQFETATDMAMPHGNPNVYLEMNYKCDVEVEVGITDGIREKPCITLNAKNAWNKIYIQLADAINREPMADKYKVYFKGKNPNQLSNVRVWLDNLKVVYL